MHFNNGREEKKIRVTECITLVFAPTEKRIRIIHSNSIFGVGVVPSVIVQTASVLSCGLLIEFYGITARRFRG